MVKKIAFIGSPGAGKSTCCHHLFVKLKKKKKNVELISEFAREYIQKHGSPQTIYEQYSIYIEQKNREENIPPNIEYVVMDTLPGLAFFYASLYSTGSPRERILLADFYKYLIDDLFLKKYDYIFYLPKTEEDQQNILNDGTRYQSSSDIDILETYMDLIFNKLHKFDNIYKLDCNFNDRIPTILKILNL